MNIDNRTEKSILIVCSHFWPSTGGLESRMGQFSTELVSSGYKVTVMTQAFPGRDSDEYRGVKIASIDAPDFSSAIRNAVSSGTYDACILVQDPLGSIIWSVENLAPPPQTKLLIQPIINEDGYSRWKDHPEFPQRLANILKAASVPLVMTKSGPDTRFMHSAGIDAVYLPNATVQVPSAGNFREQYGIAEDRFLILHVANLFWVKNHIGLMDALQDMPTSWQLVMVGNPSGEPDCVEAVKAKLATRPDILFIPGLSREWTSAAMQSADVVVLSSFGEGSPITILEAMSHRKPWLATPQCGAANDHLGGIICELDQFKPHLQALANDPALRQSLAEISYGHWSQCYSWPVALQGWIDLIECGRLQRQFEPGPELADQMLHARESIRAELSKRDDKALTTDETPLVSVIVPTCNRPELLDRSLNSICAQHYSNVEIIVVNDAGCPVEHVIGKHNSRSNIHYLVLGANKGASAARNSGLRLARGHYIAYLDDDDEYLPEHLSKTVEALRKTTHRFAYSRAEYLIETEQDGQLQVVRQRPFSNIDYDRNLLMIGNFIPTPTWVFERSLIAEIGGFDEAFDAWEDWEWLIRASEKTDFLSVPMITVEVHQRPNDLDHLGVKHRPEMRKWFEQVYAKHPAPMPELASARAEHLKRLFPDDDTPVIQSQSDSIPAIEGMALEEPAFSAARQGSLEIIHLINSAERLAEAQRLDLAAELYRLWLKHTESPLSYAVAFNLGTVLEKAGLFSEAEQAFRRSLAYNPKFAQARFGLAIQLERRGHIEEALAHLRWITHQENGVMTSEPDLYEKSRESLQRLTN